MRYEESITSQGPAGQDLAASPLLQFERWLQEANAAGINEEPNAMTVATVDEEGQPHVRTIPCKGSSLKVRVLHQPRLRQVRQIDHNPRTALFPLAADAPPGPCDRSG